MKFYLAKTLDNVDKYGDIFDLSNESEDKVETYDLEEHDYEILEKSFINQINDKCGTLLEYGDYDFFDVEKCILLKEWLIESINNTENERLKELYKHLLDYSDSAIRLNTGIAIDF